MSEAEDWAVIVRAKNQEIQKWQQQALELSNLVMPLRDENKRLREALKTYAECSDGCTCGDGWSHDPAQATLTPQGGKGGESE